MINRPDKFPDWALIDVIDPTEQTPNVLEPLDEEKQIGWVPRQVVPNSYLNWLHRITNNWLKYLDAQVTTPSLLNEIKPDPATVGAGYMIHISDLEEGGTMAFSDGTNWRKISDNSII